MRWPGTRWTTPVLLLALTATYVYVMRDVFITHRFMLTHDSVANFAPYQFAFTSVRTGTLSLWSPEMNAGEPLWPIVELHPSYEPIPLLVFAVSSSLGATGITAFSYVLLTWLVGFAFGGWLLARSVGLSPISRLFVFTVLLWSSVGVLMLYQSQYLVIGRWVPLTMATGCWFLQQPGISRATLFGVVLGFALPGYQTPYVALFTVVLACAGGRVTLTLLRLAPRIPLMVAGLFALALLLPTLTAGTEWLGMTPVARVAWPRGTRATFLPDIVAPLLGYLRSESAFYVGVVPVLLALVAVMVALKRQDPRARFWACTTAGTMFVFLGAPEMITGRDQPFLFVRDWTFVLPLVILSAAMLGGIGLDYVRALLPTRWSTPIAAALTVVAFLDLAMFASVHYRRVAFPRTPELQAREPAPIRPTSSFSMFRRREFDIAAHAPFHKQGPAVWGIPSAYLDPEPFTPGMPALVALGQIYTHGSHYLRLPRYEAVLTTMSRPGFDCIAGVTCPIVRLVETAIWVPDVGTALAALIQMPAERLKRVIVVEGADPRGAERPAGSMVERYDAAPSPAPVGTVSLRKYSANAIELDVFMHRPGFLYYADGYAPEWAAVVNGAQAIILPANGAFKAVHLAAGTQHVVLTYRPWRYVLAFALRIVGVVAGVVVFLVALRMRSGTPPPVESS